MRVSVVGIATLSTRAYCKNQEERGNGGKRTLREKSTTPGHATASFYAKRDGESNRLRKHNKKCRPEACTTAQIE